VSPYHNAEILWTPFGVVDTSVATMLSHIKPESLVARLG
jgi:hypothetical protein